MKILVVQIPLVALFRKTNASGWRDVVLVNNPLGSNSFGSNTLLCLSELTMGFPISSYVTAVKMNVSGVLNLQSKNYVDAMKCFGHGLRSLEGFVHRLENDSLEDDNKESSVDLPDSLAGVDNNNKRRLLFSVAIRAKQDELLTADSEIFALYHRALHFSLRRDLLTGTPQECGYLIVGVLLYNLGLAYQIDGLETCQSRQLGKAIDWYTLAEASLATGNVKKLDVRLCELAITNNIGHIYAFNRDYEGMQLRGGELCRRLSTLSSASQQDEEYAMFFQNSRFHSTEILLLCSPTA